VIRAPGAPQRGSTIDRRERAGGGRIAWRLRLLARNITGIGWQPLTWTAGSFGRIHVVLIRQQISF